MNLNLKNPVVVFDIESTGLSLSNDRIVEISIIKIKPNGEEEVKTRRINPTIPIPPEVTAIHGITNEDVKDCPTFKQIARSMADFMEGCDFIGYNSTYFDIPMLAEEFLRAGVDFDFKKRKLIDVHTIYRRKEPRDLTAAYKYYCGKDLKDAHSAEADTRATYEVLMSQLDKYSDLQNDMEFLAEFSTQNKLVDYAGRMVYNEQNEAVFNFGKHRGKKVEDVLKQEPSYYDWMMNGNFTLDTKQELTRIKLQQFSQKK